MTEKRSEADKLDQAAQQTPSLAHAQALAAAADRLRGQGTEKRARPTLYPVFRN